MAKNMFEEQVAQQKEINQREKSCAQQALSDYEKADKSQLSQEQINAALAELSYSCAINTTVRRSADKNAYKNVDTYRSQYCDKDGRQIDLRTYKIWGDFLVQMPGSVAAISEPGKCNPLDDLKKKAGQ